MSIYSCFVICSIGIIHLHIRTVVCTTDEENVSDELWLQCWAFSFSVWDFFFFSNGDDTFKMMKWDLPVTLVHRSPVALRRCCPVSSQSCHFWGTAVKLFVPDSRQPHCRALVSCYIKY